MLTKQDILNYKCDGVEEVEALGGIVKVKGMSAAARDLFEQRLRKLKEIEPGVTENIRAFTIIHHIVDDNDELLFTSADLEDIGRLPAKHIDKIFGACQRVSGITDEDEEDLKKK